MNGDKWNYCKPCCWFFLFFFLRGTHPHLDKSLICLACATMYASFKEENRWLFKEGGSLRGSTLHLNKECFLFGNN